MSARNQLRHKVLPIKDDNAGLGFAREKSFVRIFVAALLMPTLMPSISDILEYHYVDNESFVISKPGSFRFQVPHWAHTCVISLTGGGGGGSGASVAGPVVRAGSGGGGSASVLAMPMPINSKQRHLQLIVEIGVGGSCGAFSQPGQNGSQSLVLLGEQVLVTAAGGSGAALDQPGVGGKSFKSALNGDDGLFGGTTVGSEGSPQGGAGGSSIFSIGGAGGLPTSAATAEGSPGSSGGSGGGGGSPWGATGKGGVGGCGMTQIQWIR